MRAAYVDTSCLLSVAFEEPGRDDVVASLDRYQKLFSSDLLRAELLSAMSREGGGVEEIELLRNFVWIFPNRTLEREFRAVLSVGYIKGADLWHLGCALFLEGEIGSLDFLTLDTKQAELANELGLGRPGGIR